MANSLKIIYILLAGTGVFFVNDIRFLGLIIFFHFVVYLMVQNKQKNLWFLWKVRWFILIIFAFQAFTGPNDIPVLTIKKWTLALSYNGMLEGAVTIGKLIAMLLITQVVRFSMKEEDFTKGLKRVGLSEGMAQTIDQIMSVVHAEGNGKGSGKGGGKGGGAKRAEGENEQKGGKLEKATDVLKGRVGKIPEKLMTRLTAATENFKGNPHAALASSALAITLIRMVKIAPGLPLAPGHKNVLVIPVFLYGILRSGDRFSGLKIGSISGVLHFSMGFGKYGLLSIFEFSILGLVLDLMLKLPFRKTNLVFLMVIGAVAGAVRIGTEILLALILNMPGTFYLIYLPYVVSQILFGMGSAFVSRVLLKKIEHE